MRYPWRWVLLTGVLLADSRTRHQLEASIEPFKGLLLACLCQWVFD